MRKRVQRTERERERERENKNKIYDFFFFFFLHLMNSEVVYTQPHCSRMLRTFAYTHSVGTRFLRGWWLK